MKKYLCFIALCFLVCACSKDTPKPKEVELTKMVINENKIDLKPDLKTQLTILFTPENASNKDVIWSSSNEELASVSNTGVVTAHKLGRVIITAKNSKYNITTTSEVVISAVSMQGIQLNMEQLELLVGAEETLIAEVIPPNTTITTLLWTSSNEKIASVDQEGTVKGISPGETTIKVKSIDGKISATVKVTVQPIAVASITLNKSILNLKSGDSEKLISTVDPADATNTKVTWSSSDSKIATVSQDGTVKGINAGSAIITVKSGDGKISATAEVTVKVIAVASITLNKSILNLKSGDSEKLISTVNPADATNTKVTWSSSNSKIATVSQDGTVKGVNAGSAIITVKSGDGKTFATAEVTVLPTAVSGITINKNSLKILINDSRVLEITIYPQNADNKKVIWKSSNPSVATVSSDGSIKGIKLGSTIITATTVDGNFIVSSSIEVVSIDQFVQVYVKPNNLLASSAGNSVELSLGVYNPTNTPIEIRYIRIYIDGVLRQTYNTQDPELLNAFYRYSLGPFIIGYGAINVSSFLQDWVVEVEYFSDGKTYTTSSKVSGNTFGSVNINDFNLNIYTLARGLSRGVGIINLKTSIPLKL